MLFGVNLLAPRILLFLSFLGFLGASYAIARRFAGARTSAAVVLCMTVWGMPNYPAAMPSWYNLFLAVAAVWGLARYLESTRIRWLVFAGACAGVSILMKVIGLYTLAGLLLAVAFFEQNTAGTANDSSRPLREGLRWYSVVLTSAAVVLVLMIVRLIASDFTWPSAVHFVLPTSLIAGLLIYFEWRQPHVLPSGQRLERVLRTAGPVIAGALGPVLLFVMLYLGLGRPRRPDPRGFRLPTPSIERKHAVAARTRSDASEPRAPRDTRSRRGSARSRSRSVPRGSGDPFRCDPGDRWQPSGVPGRMVRIRHSDSRVRRRRRIGVERREVRRRAEFEQGHPAS